MSEDIWFCLIDVDEQELDILSPSENWLTNKEVDFYYNIDKLVGLYATGFFVGA